MENDIIESNMLCKKKCYDRNGNWIIYTLLEFFYENGYHENVVYKSSDKKAFAIRRFDGRDVKKAADFFVKLK